MNALVLLVLGCTRLAPSLEPADDAMLAALPEDVTVLGGAELAVLRETEIGRRIEAALPGRDAAALAAAGVPVASFDRVRFGCGDSGCAMLAEGRFAPTFRRQGMDAHTPVGPVVARRLGPDRAVAGERDAVRRLAELNTGDGGAGALDPTSLSGLVPRGEAWVLLREPEVLVDQAATRLSRQLPDRAAQLRERWALVADRADRFTSVAAALDGETVRIRAFCADGCGDLAPAWAAWQLTHARHPAARGALVVEGGVAEWSLVADAATLDALGVP